MMVFKELISLFSKKESVFFLAEELHNSTKSKKLNQVVVRRIEMREKIKTPTYIVVMGIQRKRWRWYKY